MNYNDFTTEFSYRKSLTLALDPCEATKKAIEDKMMHEFDDSIYERVNRLRPAFDSFCVNLINKALENFDFSFTNYYNALVKKTALTKDNKQNSPEYKTIKATIQGCEDKLTQAIVKAIENAMPNPMSKMGDLTSKGALNALETYVKTTTDTNIDKADAISIITSFKPMASSVMPLFNTMQTALETWLPQREIENFQRYMDNMPLIQKTLDNESIPEIHNFFEEYPEFRDFASPAAFELLLTQNGLEGYNKMISGTISENGIESKGLNLITNELNQKNKNDRGYKGPFFKKLKTLHKVPLAKVEKQFTITTLQDDNGVRTILDEVLSKAPDVRRRSLKAISAYDEDNMLIEGRNLHTLSHLMFGDHDKLPGIYIDRYIEEQKDSLNGKKMTSAVQNKINKASDAVRHGEYPTSEVSLTIDKSVAGLVHDKLMGFHLALSATESNLNFNKIKGNRKAESTIQEYFSLLKDFKDTLQTLCYYGDNPNVDTTICEELANLISEITYLIKRQDRIRNYITKKPCDLKAAKTTFLGMPGRMQQRWWYGGKFTKENFSVFKKDGKYYYFTLTNEAKPFMPEEPDINEDAYVAHVQKKPGSKSYMQLPKAIFSQNPVNAKKYFAENPGEDTLTVTEGFTQPFTVTRNECNMYIANRHRKDANDPDAAHTIMKLFEKFIRTYKEWTDYDFSAMAPADDYSHYDEFCSDIDKYALSISKINISARQIDELVEKGDALMFLITNRNMYDDRKTKKDHYAEIFLHAMAEENAHNPVIQLDSRPRIIYRPAMYEASQMPTHRKGSWLLNKRDVNGNPIPPSIYEELYKFKNNMSGTLSKDAQEYLNKKLVTFKTANSDIIKHKRYTAERYTITFSYLMNKQSPEKGIKNVGLLNEKLEHDDNGVVLSITRGTQDLLYYTITDANGNVLEEKSLNVIDGYDYMEKIRQISKDRSDEKKSWQNELTVKDLKDGYCRRAITEIVKAAYHYNASAILCEYLNDDFKDKYSCIDNQLFKGFEKKLLSRLASLTFRDRDAYAPGGEMNPIQLTHETGNTYKDGILRYVPNAYIISMDPDTGFCPVFEKNKVKTTVQKRDFFAKFNSIIINKNSIDLTFDLSKMEVKNKTAKTTWTVTINDGCMQYDREHKCYTENKDIAASITSLMPEVNVGDDVVTKIYDVPAKSVDALWKYFCIVTTGLNRDPERKMYVSPITGKATLKSQKAAMLQDSKYRVMTDAANKGLSSEKMKEHWIDTMQA